MISIFAKRAFLNTNPSQEFISKEVSYKGRGHLQRVSSMIRGDQIADKINAKMNPTEGYKDDVCIYVKPHLKKGMDFNFEGRKSYLDIIDGHSLGSILKQHPEVGVIVCSDADYEVMKNELKNEIVVIPQHHCNFERIHRNSKEVKKIGVIGESKAVNYFHPDLVKEVEKLGFEFIFFDNFFSRKDVIDFYMRIDVQLVWRPYAKVLSNPLKIVNAMSFGIPTIALREKAFDEVSPACLQVDDLLELSEKLYFLSTNRPLYETISNEGIKLSEKYHIDSISELYRRLDEE